MSNRGRHKKKKIIQKIIYADLINCINTIKNDGTPFNFKSSAQHWFNLYYLIDEQRKT